MKSKENWNPLTFDEAYVIEKKGTERPFTGEYYSSKDPGVYRVVFGQVLMNLLIKMSVSF
jgi:peptide methionine sulfoxide reductase MsrB